ncbi:PREDICTED: mitochondrial import receptor subunit TOM6 homolog [Camelina sativa]|uniref:Mitochondrial import receptor subunit TOM6 homolog n=1 Tax=Camelina sativa TaxID=90675 RepID=A0ABM1QZQ5_CAMSA|nr:PREDICTED: mitochondrial import receptor subunit TOM6 homolog [Camelina sativa]
MFPGVFMQKPDKAVALKELKSHVTLFGACVVLVRSATYVLSYFSDSMEDLKINL